MKKIILSLIFINIILSQSNFEKAFNSIQPNDPYNYCKEMTLDKYKGRFTGHEGYTRAAQWAAAKFKEWGLKPASNEYGYLQPYPSPYTIIEEAEMTIINYNKEEIKLKKPVDFLPVLFADNCKHKAELVFVGWGISAPDLNYDDYANLDVKDKFVICFRGVPDRKENRFQNHDEHRTRLQTAKSKGAKGLFYIYPEPIAMPNGDFIKDFSGAIISEKTANIILSEKNITVDELKRKLTDTKRTSSFYLNTQIDFYVKSQHYPDGIGYNVVGYLEGSDPNLNKETIVYGAHYDFCGEHMGILYVGANDNASGSANVMEIAEAYSKLDKMTKRSVAFILFGGEEMGLMGSHYYADNMPTKLKNVDAMINFDMTGHGDKARASVSENPLEFKNTLLEADKLVNTLQSVGVIKSIGVRSSDFAPFFKKGAKVASFSSNGPHQFYHLLGDNIYRINPDILADIAKLGFTFGYKWADR